MLAAQELARASGHWGIESGASAPVHMAASAMQVHRLAAGPVQPYPALAGGHTQSRQQRASGCCHMRRGVAVEALRLVPTGEASPKPCA